MASERRFDCNLCIHMNVCPAYEVTQTECDHYIPQGNVLPVVRCRDCIHDGLTTCPLCYIEQQTLVFVNHDADFYCGKGERKHDRTV